MDELTVKRKRKTRQLLGQALLEHFGGEEFEHFVGAVADAAPDVIREAMAEACELNEMKYLADVARAEQEERPGYCTNAVCRDWIQSEGEEEIPTDSGFVEIRTTGRESFCGKGAAWACGCLFRMKEAPPNYLDTVSCEQLPEWAEAINMLRRADLLEPDEFGCYNGTDFALHQNISVVWWNLIELLIETGRIERSWVDDEMIDKGTESREARSLLFPSLRNIAG